MFPAARTELLNRKFLCLALLVLAGGVITALAAVACQSDQISHFRTCSYPLADDDSATVSRLN
jgi:hypothetical protein